MQIALALQRITDPPAPSCTAPHEPQHDHITPAQQFTSSNSHFDIIIYTTSRHHIDNLTPRIEEHNNTMAQPPRCRLLELPPELREPVYAELLTPIGVEIRANDAPRTTGTPASTVATTRFHGRAFREDAETLHPAILRTCRKIYQEAEPLLYKPRVLRISPRATEPASPDKLFDVRKLRFIRRLEGLHIHLWTLPSRMDLDTQLSTCLTENVSPDLTVSLLVLTLPDHRERIVFGAAACMARDWFRVARVTDVTTVHITSPISNGRSWRMVLDGEWKECSIPYEDKSIIHGCKC